MSKSEDIPKGVKGFDERSLCPDGACLGVVEENGRCSVCGKFDKKVGMGTKDSSGKKAEEAEEEESYRGRSIKEDVKTEEEDIGAEDLKIEPYASGGSGFEPDRKVCSDGSCIGIIGKNGTCKECGKPYSG